VRGVESPSPAALVSGEMEDGSGGKYSLYIVWCNGMSGRKSCELRDVSFVVLLEVQVNCRTYFLVSFAVACARGPCQSGSTVQSARDSLLSPHV
jgi:hypothetical protein